jgi:hypothetical protein
VHFRAFHHSRRDFLCAFAPFITPGAPSCALSSVPDFLARLPVRRHGRRAIRPQDGTLTRRVTIGPRNKEKKRVGNLAVRPYLPKGSGMLGITVALVVALVGADILAMQRKQRRSAR